MTSSAYRLFGWIVLTWVVIAAAVGALSPQADAAQPAAPVVAELYDNDQYRGSVMQVTELDAGEIEIELAAGIASLTLEEGWDALLCSGPDGSGTCRYYSHGRYPALRGFPGPARYACVHFRKAPGELGGCPSFNSQPVEHTLGSVPPLSEEACRNLYDLELEPNLVRPAMSSQTYVSKVIVLVHNPTVQEPETEIAKDLFSWMGWPSMGPRVACLSRFYEHVSSGRMQFEIVGMTDIDMWPDNDMQKGWDYVSTDVNRPIEPDDKVSDQELGVLFVDKVFIDSRSVCDLIRAGDADEVWIYNAGGFGYFETALLGPDSYEYNWRSLRGVDCGRTFRVAAGSASRGLMVHNLMHGMESTLRAAQGVLIANDPNIRWQLLSGDSSVHLFMRSPKDIVEGVSGSSLVTGCGNTHFTPSMQTRRVEGGWEHEYWYGDQALAGGSEPYAWNRSSACTQIPSLSTRGVLTPALADEIRQAGELVNCSAWQCSEFGFYEYWHEQWSQGIGCQLTSAEDGQGMSYDWWRYFADPVAIYEPCTPPGVLGDPDCDGARTIADAELIVRYRVGDLTVRNDCSGPAGDLGLAESDMDRNGVVDVADALMIATCVASPAAPFC